MSREVKISAVTLLMTDSIRASEGALIEKAFEAVDEAALEKPDIICLPEDYDLLARPREREMEYKGENIPGGPVTTRMQEKAARYGCCIVNTILEATEAGRPYNTATLIGRDGGIVGKYRKIHLAPDELAYAQAGSDPVVFECDFGRVAVMICMDINFPEVARVYALKGADIIFWPRTAVYSLPYAAQHVPIVRAIDNRVYCVSGDYIYLPTTPLRPIGEARIIDPLGTVRAGTGRRPGVASAVVDLDEIGDVRVVGGSPVPTLREQALGRRRPDLYGILRVEDEERLWELENPTVVEA